MNRVAITGLGAICGLGHNLNDVWSKALEGKSGISLIEQIDTELTPAKIGGEIKGFEVSQEILDPKEASRYDRFIQIGATAAFEAYKDAGLFENNPYEKVKLGAILGVGMGGFPIIESSHVTFMEKGGRRVSPFFIPAIIPNMATGLLSIKLGLMGVNYTVASACASSNHAITQALFEIQSGRQDLMITGGTESVFSQLTCFGFANMKALSRRNDEPEKASRPFDTARDGFVMGEGSGILILENLEKAKARGAKIYGEVLGGGASSDAYHITAPHPDGAGAIHCMEQAISLSGIKATDIDYINAHGTSTPLGDIAETKAIKNVFGDHAKKIAISSTKSMTGHLLGAAGGLESVFCAKALFHGKIPPTINLDNQDPECDLYYTPNEAISKDINYALNNSFGFGSTNSTLIFKKYTN